jgi:hypothetical protein
MPVHRTRQAILIGRYRAEHQLADLTERISTLASTVSGGARRGNALPDGPRNLHTIYRLLGQATEAAGAIAALDALMDAYAQAGDPIHHIRLRKAAGSAPTDTLYFAVCACGEQPGGNATEPEAALMGAIHCAHAEGLPAPTAHFIHVNRARTVDQRDVFVAVCSCGDYMSEPGSANTVGKFGLTHAREAANAWWSAAAGAAPQR